MATTIYFYTGTGNSLWAAKNYPPLWGKRNSRRSPEPQMKRLSLFQKMSDLFSLYISGEFHPPS